MLLWSCVDSRGATEDQVAATNAGGLHESTPVQSRSLALTRASCCASGAVSCGMQLKYAEASWRAGDENPPFVADNTSVVEFLKAVLDRAVDGTQTATFEFERCGHKARFGAAVWPRSSIYFARFAAFRIESICAQQGRFWGPSNILTRKGVGKGAMGRRAAELVEAFFV
eukprot:5782419-Pleurochrysis_carterae.AAC.1